MAKIITMIMLALLVAGCAQISDRTMIPGVHGPGQDVPDVKIERGFWLTQRECHKRLWNCGNGHVSILVFLVNFGVIPACNTVYVTDGTIERAEIFLAFGDFLLDHEMEHVITGRADEFY